MNIKYIELLSDIFAFRRLAEAHNRLDLLETALRFIQVNFPQVSQEEEFLDLPKEHLVHFLSSDYIHIDTEFQVHIFIQEPYVRSSRSVMSKINIC